ncbi:MAG: DUF4317 domain-containing protein [Lachnospiraceae bacterium]|nr:DUF4317 domain-containing protein [Lachnospiraceae bacterium]
MTANDIKEIKKQFSLDNCTIDHICGCYVNNEKEKQAVSKDAFMSLPDEEQHKYFEIFKKTLGGTAGKNIIELEFPLAEEAEGGKQAFLLALRDSHLDDDGLIDRFYDRVIESYDTVEKYYIILIHAIYDIPGMTTDRIINEDASEGVFDYICCAVCPVKLEKGTLSYDPEENRIAEKVRDWIVADPAHGFLFPEFNDRTGDIHGVLYYTKKSEEMQDGFIDTVLGANPPMTAGNQADFFNTVVTETLGDEISLGDVMAINDNVRIMIRDHSDDPEPYLMDKKEIRKVFERSGIDNEVMEDFDWKYDEVVKTVSDEEGPDEAPFVQATNLQGVRKIDIRTPDIVIKVNPERTDLIETRFIDGRECLVIAVDDRVEINGLEVHTIHRRDRGVQP